MKNSFKKDKIGIVIPVANESETIKAFCEDLIKNIYQLKINAKVFIVIDNASTDNTKTILEKIVKKNQLVELIYEPKNRNVVDAYVRGFREAIKNKCDFIIEMDGGFSHLPSELHKFIQGYKEGYDCVFGIRPLWSINYKVPLKRRLLSLGGTILSDLLLGTRYKDMTSGFEGFRLAVIKQILKKPLQSKAHFYQTEMRFRAKNFRNKEVYITYNNPTPRVGFGSVYNSFSTLFSLTRERWFGKN
jgi:dolichol-phosphate mannosyltransferase